MNFHLTLERSSRIGLLLAALGLAALTFGQWSTDPATPMAVTSASTQVGNWQSFSDGGTGWYVFWCDGRTDPQKRQLYGQRFDSTGTALWEAGGTHLLTLPGCSVNILAGLCVAGGDVILCVGSSATTTYAADTMRAYRFDAYGAPVWAAPTLLSVNGPGIFGNCWSFDTPQAVPCGDGAWFCYRGDSQASNGYYVTSRVRNDGSAAFPVPGKKVPNNAGYGPFQALADGAGGLVVSWRCGNGAGTCHYATRMDSTGTAVWPAVLNLAAGGAGLSYAFNTIADSTGAFVSIWEESANLGMQRFDTMGDPLWPVPFYACTAPSGQANPAPLISNGKLMVAWRDDRNIGLGVQGLYLQRYDLTTGAAELETDGVLLWEENVYVPTPRLVPSLNGGAIGIMDFTGASKYCALRVDHDGLPLWTDPTSFATANGPFYGDRMEMPDGTGGVVSFWKTSGDGLYGARIYPDGSLGDHTGMAENDIQQHLLLYPVPATGLLTVEAHTILHALRITSLDGRTCLEQGVRAQGRATVDVGSLTPGCYLIEAWTDRGRMVQRFTKQ